MLRQTLYIFCFFTVFSSKLFSFQENGLNENRNSYTFLNVPKFESHYSVMNYGMDQD